MRISDWSSDVCSSDLARATGRPGNRSELTNRLKDSIVRKKTIIITAAAALGVLAVAAGPVLADEMPPGMPDIVAAPKGKAVSPKAEAAPPKQGMPPGREQMHAPMMPEQRMPRTGAPGPATASKSP